jgi:acyl carrier protein
MRWLHSGARGLPGLSVAWGIWAGEGMARAAGVQKRFERHGLVPLEPDLAVACLQQSLDRDERAVVIASIDWSRFAPQQSNERSFPLLKNLVEASSFKASLGSLPTETTGQPTSAVSMQDLTPAEQRRHLLTLVLRAAASVLRHPDPDRIDPDVGYLDLGMDSLMTIELQQQLQSACGVALSTTLAFDYPTPARTAGHLFSLLAADTTARRHDERNGDLQEVAPAESLPAWDDPGLLQAARMLLGRTAK